MAIPDYAFDRHTQKNRKIGRGIDHFYNEGTMLSNQVEQPKEAELKAKAWTMAKNSGGFHGKGHSIKAEAGRETDAALSANGPECRRFYAVMIWYRHRGFRAVSICTFQGNMLLFQDHAEPSA